MRLIRSFSDKHVTFSIFIHNTPLQKEHTKITASMAVPYTR